MPAVVNAIERAGRRLLGAADAAANRLYTWRHNPLYQSGTVVVAMFLVLIANGALAAALLSRRGSVGVGGTPDRQPLDRQLGPGPASLRFRRRHRGDGRPRPPDGGPAPVLGAARPGLAVRHRPRGPGARARLDRLRDGLGHLRAAAGHRRGALPRRPADPLRADRARLHRRTRPSPAPSSFSTSSCMSRCPSASAWCSGCMCPVSPGPRSSRRSGSAGPSSDSSPPWPSSGRSPWRRWPIPSTARPRSRRTSSTPSGCPFRAASRRTPPGSGAG